MITLLWYIQRYLILSEIEALNLDLEKYLAEIQLPGNITVSFSQYHRVILRVLEWLALEISITSYKLQMLQQLTVACSLAFFLQPWARHALLSFHHSTKHAPSHLSSS
jgi:hypothetical protein